MNKLSGPIIFIIPLCVVAFIIAGYNFYHYHIAKNYPVSVYAGCDPQLHDCFIAADPEIANPTFQSGPYSKVEAYAYAAPKCLDEHTCSDFTCDEMTSCTVVYCSEETKEEGEICSYEI